MFCVRAVRCARNFRTMRTQKMPKLCAHGWDVGGTNIAKGGVHVGMCVRLLCDVSVWKYGGCSVVLSQKAQKRPWLALSQVLRVRLVGVGFALKGYAQIGAGEERGAGVKRGCLYRVFVMAKGFLQDAKEPFKHIEEVEKHHEQFAALVPMDGFVA